MEVDEQEAFGVGLLLQPAVLAGEDARGATERKPEQHDEKGRGNDRDHEDAGTRRVDAFLDGTGVLVDPVDPDGIAVHVPADRHEQLEVRAGQRRERPPSTVVGSAVDVAGNAVAGVGGGHQRADREAGDREAGRTLE